MDIPPIRVDYIGSSELSRSFARHLESLEPVKSVVAGIIAALSLGGTDSQDNRGGRAALVAVEPQLLPLDDRSHGAAFANLAFTQPGSRLIEFFQEGEDNNCSNRLAAVSGLRYGLLGCQLGGQAKAKLPVLGATGVA
jgi:hypothetical protein